MCDKNEFKYMDTNFCISNCPYSYYYVEADTNISVCVSECYGNHSYYIENYPEKNWTECFEKCPP